jgi:predicted Zn finger-like uncharacterized protein
MMTVTCPGCQAQLKVPESLLGRKAKCNKCATVLQVPAHAVTERPGVGLMPAALADDFDGAAEPRPLRRRPREDDEDGRYDEDRPRRRKKKSGLLLGCLLGSAALLLIGGGAAALFFFLRGSGRPAGLRYLPDDSPLVVSVRVADIRASGAWQELTREIPQLQALADKGDNGLALSDVKTIVWGGNPTTGSVVTVMETTRSVAAKDLQAKKRNQRYTPRTVGSYTLYEGQFDAFCVVSSRTILTGAPQTLRTVLERNAAPRLSATMERALADVDFSKAVASAMDMSAFANKKKDGGPRLGGGLFDALGGFGGFADKSTTEPETVALEVEVSKDVTTRLVLGYRDASAAEAGKRDLDKAKAQVGDLTQRGVPKEVADALGQVQVTLSGARLTATSTIQVGPLARGVKGLVENPFAFRPVPPQQKFEPPKGNPFAPPPGQGQVVLNVGGVLANADPFDRVRQNMHAKVHTLQMTAGRHYQIDLVSGQFDSYLRLEDSAGIQLAEDDDGGGFPNARIHFNCQRNDNYRIIVTSFAARATGAYTLTVREQ